MAAPCHPPNTECKLEISQPCNMCFLGPCKVLHKKNAKEAKHAINMQKSHGSQAPFIFSTAWQNYVGILYFPNALRNCVQTELNHLACPCPYSPIRALSTPRPSTHHSPTPALPPYNTHIHTYRHTATCLILPCCNRIDSILIRTKLRRGTQHAQAAAKCPGQQRAERPRCRKGGSSRRTGCS
eukprot:1161979-Pelagomonas_calceolata.AAC.11